MYCVGCVIVDESGQEVAAAYTGERRYSDAESKSSPHAEEIALEKLSAESKRDALTLYSSMEPCSERFSGLPSCCTRIIAAGVRRVVFAAKEPYDDRLKITCCGAENLCAAGIEAVHFSSLSDDALRAAKRVDHF